MYAFAGLFGLAADAGDGFLLLIMRLIDNGAIAIT